jgi:hypothetical protein
VSFAHLVAGNPALALEAGKDAVKVSADPVYSIIPNALIAFSHSQMGEFEEAAKIANATLAFSEKFGCEFHGTAASLILGGSMIASGKMALGLKQIEDILLRLKKIEKRSFMPTGEYILGKIYFQIATGEGSVNLSSLLKNTPSPITIGSIYAFVLEWAEVVSKPHLTPKYGVAPQGGICIDLFIQRCSLANIHP